MDNFMAAHNKVVSFKRADVHNTEPDIHSYAKYATARALAAAIYEAGIGPDELAEAMCDHIEAIDN